jgi:type I restriction enzyme M protein
MATTLTVPELDTRLDALKAEAAKLGYTEQEDFKTDRGDEARASVCWGIEQGAPTARVLLLALPDGALSDTAADDVLLIGYQAPADGASEPVAAIVDAGGGVRYFDLDPFAPAERDQLPRPGRIADLKRLSREPTFEWSLRVYERLQRGFDDFHETVYSSVRDTVDGKNDIIDETAKFLFLELFRLTHDDVEKEFDFEGQRLTLDEVFTPAAFGGADGKKAVARVKAAFEAVKGHPDYATTTDAGEQIPIFPADVHLKLSEPRNYATLIRLLQDLPPLTDNQGRPIRRPATLKEVAGDVLGRAFDVFLRHKFEKEGVGIYLTPAPVKRAMVDIVLHDIETFDAGKLAERDAQGRPIFRAGDPAGGSLGFLVALLPQLKRLLEQINLSDEERETLWNGMLEHSFISADSSPRMVRLGRLNMALQGAPRARVFNTSNSLTSPLLKPGTFDLILTNPPFGAPKAKTPQDKKATADLMAHFRSDIDFDALKKKGKGVMTPSQAGLAMGAKPNSKGEWDTVDAGVDLSVLFLDRCLQLLKPGGRLVMIVPDSLLSNANTRYVREYLIGKKDEKTGQFHGGKGIVKAVISLPADTFKLSGTGAKTSILYVQKRQADPRDPARFLDESQTDVFMAVANSLGYAVKNNQEVYTEGGKFIPNDLVPIVGAYQRGE